MTPLLPAAAAAERSAQVRVAAQRFGQGVRWQPLEYLFWCLPVAAYFLFPGNYLLLSQIAITGLFALSLDLIFGYAGIISLGHAAFFGVGAYTVGLLGLNGMGDPLLGLALAALFAAILGFFSSFLLLRGSELARLMVTLGVALMLYELANKFSDITGGVDGIPGIEVKPVLGLFEFDLFGRVGFVYSAVVLFLLFWLARRLVHSPFGQSLRGIQMNAERMPALGVSINRRLVAIYTVGAAYAGVAGALLAQTNQFVSLAVLSFANSADLLLILILGGTGRLYGGLIGAIVFIVAKHVLSDINPQYWHFWLGLALVLLVMFARGGILGTAVQWLQSRRHRAEARQSALRAP